MFKVPAVALEDAASLNGASIEICHNEICGTAELPELPANGYGVGFDVEGPIHTYAYADVTLWHFDAESHGFDVGYTLGVEISAPHAMMRDGDIYTANVTAADNSVLASAAFRASSHQEWYPNGERCSDRPCRVAMLAPL